MSNVTVLVVDDEAPMRRVLEIMLQQMGHRAILATDGAQALELLERERVDLVLTDLRMPEIDGIGLLRGIAARQTPVPAIVMTAQGSVASAVEAMKLGAADYLLRPFDVEVLELAVERVLSREQMKRENAFLREQASGPSDTFFGVSAPMQRVFEQIQQVGRTRASVLITGETGTGKDLAARAIHAASDRASRLFVPINCAAMPAEMVEAELFGHERGSFTGAVKDRIGKFELASGGTIFLDEITEMPIPLQSKLLRVLQEASLERLGSNRTIELDMRVIAASNRDPREAIEQGKLREDLYYRINVFTLALPPLRDRPDDLLGLIEQFALRQGRRIEVSQRALQTMLAYRWPGNVRELDNVVQRALILNRSGLLDLEDLPQDIVASPSAASPALRTLAATLSELPENLDLTAATEALERRYIAEALRVTGNNKRKAATLLGVSERTLWYKLERDKAEPSGESSGAD